MPTKPMPFKAAAKEQKGQDAVRIRGHAIAGNHDVGLVCLGEPRQLGCRACVQALLILDYEGPGVFHRPNLTPCASRPVTPPCFGEGDELDPLVEWSLSSTFLPRAVRIMRQTRDAIRISTPLAAATIKAVTTFRHMIFT